MKADLTGANFKSVSLLLFCCTTRWCKLSFQRRGFRANFYPCCLSSCLQLLFFLLTVDTWRWDPFVWGAVWSVKSCTFSPLFLLSVKNVSLLIWAVCSSCQANNVLCCVCLGRELGEKRGRNKSKNSFSPILTAWVWLSKGPDTSSWTQGTKQMLVKIAIEHTTNTIANAPLTTVI